MRFTRNYETTAAFRARQGAFWFAPAAQAVVAIALSVRKTLGSWWGKTRPAIAQVKLKCHQLVLELNGIAQMPFLERA